MIDRRVDDCDADLRRWECERKHQYLSRARARAAARGSNLRTGHGNIVEYRCRDGWHIGHNSINKASSS